MKNWEDLKDLSYINIKLTKAKSLSEGVTRCQIDRLTRRNPIYEHLQLHKIHKRSSPCNICKPPPQYRPPRTPPSCPTPKKKYSASVSLHNYSLTMQKIMSETPRSQKARVNQNLKKEAECLVESLRRTKSNLERMVGRKREMEDYFLTAVDDISCEANEDRGLSIREVQTQDDLLKEELGEMEKKRRQRDKKVKQLKKGRVFPFTTGQMGQIVAENLKTTMTSRKKLDRMVTSVYEYKSCKNYISRVKRIASILE